MKIFGKITVLISILFLAKLVWRRELNLLIHPRYFWLIYLSLVVLIVILFFQNKKPRHEEKMTKFAVPLLLVFVMGIFVDFKPLSSLAQRQISYANIQSTNQLSRDKYYTSFKVKTDDLTLEELVTVFSANPEPTTYLGEPVNVTGFYFETADSSPMIARHVLSCCAADARLIGIWLDEPLDVEVDTWIELHGSLSILEIEGARLVSIKADDYKIIETPDNPYVTQ